MYFSITSVIIINSIKHPTPHSRTYRKLKSNKQQPFNLSSSRRKESKVGTQFTLTYRQQLQQQQQIAQTFVQTHTKMYGHARSKVKMRGERKH